jgi:hypothetical protein
MKHFKATGVDGKDFRTSTVNYALALTTGEPVVHPGYPTIKMVPNKPATYLSVSTEKAETLIGGAWPCRLFEVVPIGYTLDGLDASKYKRACTSLRVIRELPAHEALGPNGARVAALIERGKSISAAEAAKLQTAWGAAWDARGAAGDAAWDAARGAARDAGDAAWDARGAAGDAAWDAARDARDAARDAARAELTRDLITPEQYDILAGPWNSVIGELPGWKP